MAKQKHERIGDWDVSLDIPQYVRDAFRKDLEFIAENGVGKREFRGAIFSLQDKSYEEQEALLLEEARKNALTNRGECYAYHSLIGSSTDIMPSAFGDISSYVDGRVVNLRGQVKEQFNKETFDTTDLIVNYPIRMQLDFNKDISQIEDNNQGEGREKQIFIVGEYPSQLWPLFGKLQSDYKVGFVGATSTHRIVLQTYANESFDTILTNFSDSNSERIISNIQNVFGSVPIVNVQEIYKLAKKDFFMRTKKIGEKLQLSK